MSLKFKFIFFVIFSCLCAIATGIYFWQRYPSAPLAANSENKNQDFTIVNNSTTNAIAYPERQNYQAIPVEGIKTGRQGTDPAMLALDVFDTIETSQEGSRSVEVTFPKPNQALVTITQTEQIDPKIQKAIKYRVEMTSFGRTLLVNSPPMWQVVWAGSQRQCTRTRSGKQVKVQPCNY